MTRWQRVKYAVLGAVATLASSAFCFFSRQSAMTRLNLDYVVVDAFASETFGGNPAAVVFLDEHSGAVLNDSQRKLITQEFNQPVTAFVTQFQTSVVSGGTLGPFGIQWITPSGEELRLCGHGTLATSHALFNKFLPAGAEGAVKLQTKYSGELTVRRDAKGHIQLTFPAGDLHPAPEDLVARVKTAIGAAVPALPADGSAVKAVRVGAGLTYGTYVLVEVDDSVDIAAMQVDSKALVSGLPVFVISSWEQREISFYFYFLFFGFARACKR